MIKSPKPDRTGQNRELVQEVLKRLGPGAFTADRLRKCVLLAAIEMDIPTPSTHVVADLLRELGYDRQVSQTWEIK